MKKITSRALAFAAALCVLAGCSSVPAGRYRIAGTWKDGDGKLVYLKQQVGKQAYEVLDSAVVAGGKFAFDGQLEDITLRTLSVDQHNNDLILTLEENLLKVTVSTKLSEKKGTPYITVAIGGGKEQKVLEKSKLLEMGKSMMQLGMMMAAAQAKGNPAKLDSIVKAFEVIQVAQDSTLRAFIAEHTDSYAIAYLLSGFVATSYPLAEVEGYYEQLTPRVKESSAGKQLAARVAALKMLNVGSVAPDIELPAPDGTPVKLSSLRGKYVLLDFWASWCGPCLREMPNVKDIYSKYRSKGFEVYAVSLDSKREAWTKAIESNQLGWLHVSSVLGWDCPVAATYNVTGIPKMFLLDTEGRIVATDLRGEELQAKVASLFQ
ncbi:MAG: AhpC/TSA family protein [Prevotellaceae bacterium]|jgi:peroxiredoxin|nr:AhpC/TSA family protein [Prevotellaceae bacterium]